MIIKVLGSGCSNCRKLEEMMLKAVAQLGLDAEVVKVTDIGEIMAFGVMATPALAIDEELRLAGRVPSYDEVVTILRRSAD